MTLFLPLHPGKYYLAALKSTSVTPSPGAELKRKWTNIRDYNRKEIQKPKRIQAVQLKNPKNISTVTYYAFLHLYLKTENLKATIQMKIQIVLNHNDRQMKEKKERKARAKAVKRSLKELNSEQKKKKAKKIESKDDSSESEGSQFSLRESSTSPVDLEMDEETDDRAELKRKWTNIRDYNRKEIQKPKRIQAVQLKNPKNISTVTYYAFLHLYLKTENLKATIQMKIQIVLNHNDRQMKEKKERKARAKAVKRSLKELNSEQKKKKAKKIESKDDSSESEGSQFSLRESSTSPVDLEMDEETDDRSINNYLNVTPEKIKDNCYVLIDEAHLANSDVTNNQQRPFNMWSFGNSGKRQEEKRERERKEQEERRERERKEQEARRERERKEQEEKRERDRKKREDDEKKAQMILEARRGMEEQRLREEHRRTTGKWF
ncbi:uncharacterized protein PFB0765w-like [Colias croceus]|uniref:uncharacterized protein PFB0765w-like n=1 Tax=Colias crocea TaxID=72248 RepID=UPI001E27B7D9|nr:uncharacterized protein PFB0765w-like [Colias croceus]